MTYNKQCIYFTPYYSQQDKQGKPKVSKYWCVARNGFIKKCPKICNSENTNTNSV